MKSQWVTRVVLALLFADPIWASERAEVASGKEGSQHDQSNPALRGASNLRSLGDAEGEENAAQESCSGLDKQLCKDTKGCKWKKKTCKRSKPCKKLKKKKCKKTTDCVWKKKKCLDKPNPTPMPSPAPTPPSSPTPTPGSNDKIAVFLLAGQSNMQGHGYVETFGDHPYRMSENLDATELQRLERQGESWPWVVRDNVRVCGEGSENDGDNKWRAPDESGVGQKLTVGFGLTKTGEIKIGPELGIGLQLADLYPDRTVILVKMAWGGKSLRGPFRPPSAGAVDRDDIDDAGSLYQQSVAFLQSVLNDPSQCDATLAGRETSLEGFIWFQGWNDLFWDDWTGTGVFEEKYESLLHDLAGDIRNTFSKPNLPVVVGGVGVPKDWYWPTMDRLRAAQQAFGQNDANGAYVDTQPYWDYDEEKRVKCARDAQNCDAADFPRQLSGGPHHYNGVGHVYFRMGDAMGRSMVELLQ